jgi:hypothetical protein
MFSLSENKGLHLKEVETNILSKYMLFTGWEVRTEKYFPEVSEADRDRRSRRSKKVVLQNSKP